MSIVTRLRAGWPGNQGLIPSTPETSPLRPQPPGQTASAVHVASYLMATRVVPQGKGGWSMKLTDMSCADGQEWLCFHLYMRHLIVTPACYIGLDASFKSVKHRRTWRMLYGLMLCIMQNREINFLSVFSHWCEHFSLFVMWLSCDRTVSWTVTRSIC